MNKKRTGSMVAVPLAQAQLQGNEIVQTPIGDITLTDNYFDTAASQRLYDDMDYQRACQTYIWSTPLVSIATWRDREAAAYRATSDTDFGGAAIAEGKARYRHGKPDDSLHP